MSLPSTILAYQDCLDFMDKALDDDKGARVHFLTRDQAEVWRMRCNMARKLDRDQNRRIHEPGHQMHGCSVYDPMQFTIAEDTEGDWWVYARKMVLDPGRVELLSEVEPNHDDEAEA